MLLYAALCCSMLLCVLGLFSLLYLINCCSVCFICSKRSTCPVAKCYISFDGVYFSLVVLFVLRFLRILGVGLVLLTLLVLCCSMLFSVVL